MRPASRLLSTRVSYLIASVMFYPAKIVGIVTRRDMGRHERVLMTSAVITCPLWLPLVGLNIFVLGLEDKN